MTEVLVWEVRAIPLWLLEEYLQELGGRKTGSGQIEGDSWAARLVQIEDHQVGSLIIGQVRLEVSGNPQAVQILKPQLEKKLLRAGG